VEGHHENLLGFVKQIEFWLAKDFPQKKITCRNFAKGGKGSNYLLHKLFNSIHNQPDAIVILCGHNEFLNNTVPFYYENLLVSKNYSDQFAWIRLIKFLNRRKENLKARESKPRERDKSFYARKTTYYRNLRIAMEEIKSRNIPLFLCTAPANVLNWPPNKMSAWRNIDTQRSFSAIKQCQSLIVEKKLAKAKEKIEQGLMKNTNSAMWTYLMGHVLVLEKKYQKAHAVLVKAKDLDPFPFRVLNNFNDYIRTISKEKDVHLVDVEELFRENSPNRLVGFNLIIDNCHPSPQGYFLIAKKLIQKMATTGTLPQINYSIELGKLDTYMNEIGYGDELRCRYLMRNALYCMTKPFFNYDISQKYLQQAKKINPLLWQIWANLATIALLEGRKQEGIQYLQKAYSLKKDIIELKTSMKAPYLKEALSASGVDIKQVTEYK